MSKPTHFENLILGCSDIMKQIYAFAEPFSPIKIENAFPKTRLYRENILELTLKQRDAEIYYAPEYEDDESFRTW